MKSHGLHVINLIEWIEVNLHNRISVNDISMKSGYTRWHLQKIFKEHTGFTMSEYVRARRLCKAAFELRYSNKLISEIAKTYHFDSQSSFTRAFSSYYEVSPAKYRDMSSMELGRFVYKYIPNDRYDNITVKYVSFDHLILYGCMGAYICPVNEVKNPHRSYRKPKRKSFIFDNNLLHEEVYSLAKFMPNDSKSLNCDYHLGIKTPHPGWDTLPYISGDYLQFDYEGDEDGIYDFVMSIYFKILQKNRLIRRDGYDVELFKYVDEKNIKYSYFIPVQFDVQCFLDLFY